MPTIGRRAIHVVNRNEKRSVGGSHWSLPSAHGWREAVSRSYPLIARDMGDE